MLLIHLHSVAIGYRDRLENVYGIFIGAFIKVYTGYTEVLLLIQEAIRGRRKGNPFVLCQALC